MAKKKKSQVSGSRTVNTTGEYPSYLDMLDQTMQATNNNNAMMMDFNARQASATMGWQQYMSNSTHQREVADLKLAGLNPVLSANSGAVSYSASSASANPENPGILRAQLYMNQANNANQLKQIRETNANNLAITSMNNAVGLKQAAYALQAAQTSAAAQRYAAGVSAAAALGAAATSAQAQKEVARINQKTSNYSADQQLAGIQYSTDHSKSGTTAGIISNILDPFADKFFNGDDSYKRPAGKATKGAKG